MKNKLILVTLTIILGITFTFFVLNKDYTYAKEDYLVYAFQVGSFENIENAENYANKLTSSVILKQDNLYKVYVAMYKDIDLVNNMVVYFEDKNINIYLKSIEVTESFYTLLDNYEKLLRNPITMSSFLILLFLI